MAKRLLSAEGSLCASALVLWLVVGSAWPATAADKIRLGLHLKEGQVFRLSQVIESETVQTIQGQEMRVNQTFGVGYSFEVQQVAADGNATCRVVYTSLQYQLDGPTGKLEYDSAKPTGKAAPGTETFAAMLGKSFTLRLSATGRISEIQGLEQMISELVKTVSLPDGATRSTLEKQFNDQFGAQSVKENMEQSIMIAFPDGPVDLGDSWVRRVTTSRPYPLLIENTCTLRERRAGVAVIDISSALASDPGGKPLQIGSMILNYGISGERKGQIEVEEESGWTVSARYTQELSGTLKMDGGPQGSMSWPITMKMTIRTESRK